jgi:hypothetical protein
MKIALIILAIGMSSAAYSQVKILLKDKAGNTISGYTTHEACMKARSYKSKAGVKGTYCVSK